jgi:hypothetical protein
MFSFSGNLGTKYNSEINKVSTPISAYENVTTHEGDLVINGTQTFLIENCVYVQTGNTYVSDYGKLVIDNSLFIVNQAHMGQYEARIDGHASLEIVDSEITSHERLPTGATTEGLSRVTIQNANVTWSFSFFGQHIAITNSTLESIAWRNSYVSVANSTINTIGIHFDAAHVATIDDLKPNLYQSWQYRLDASYLVLENTSVKAWLLCFFSDSIITVTDSELESVSLHFDAMAEISGLRPSKYGYLNLQANESVNVSYDLTLENTSVRHWTIVAYGGSKMVIRNTSAHIAAFESGKVHVEDSTVDLLHICDNAEATIMNSRINGLLFQNFHGSVFFDETEVEIGVCHFHGSDFYLSGNFVFIQRDVGFLCVSSKITRSFNLIAEDYSYNPMENVKLTLSSQSGVSIWNGTTDGVGQANFNLTFADGNYTDDPRLEAVKGNYSASMNVGFLSDTPVVLTMHYFADLNADGRVNIQDITIVAVAYNSRLGDPNWNKIADLDKNNIVNIIDISTVAKDYGKTV